MLMPLAGLVDDASFHDFMEDCCRGAAGQTVARASNGCPLQAPRAAPAQGLMQAPLGAVHAGASGQAAQQQPAHQAAVEDELRRVEAAIAAQRERRLAGTAALQGMLWRRSQERAKLRQLEGRLRSAEARMSCVHARRREQALQAEGLTTELAEGQLVRGSMSCGSARSDLLLPCSISMQLRWCRRCRSGLLWEMRWSKN